MVPMTLLDWEALESRTPTMPTQEAEELLFAAIETLRAALRDVLADGVDPSRRVFIVSETVGSPLVRSYERAEYLRIIDGDNRYTALAISLQHRPPERPGYCFVVLDDGRSHLACQVCPKVLGPALLPASGAHSAT